MRAVGAVATMKATAVAHPIQGLVKYHGMRDHDRRYPYHDSISVCTAPSRTVTTVQADPDREEDIVRVDGERLPEIGRVGAVFEEVRQRAGKPDVGIHLESESNFPTNVGLGSSASGMAAAAVATAGALEWDADLSELSGIARLGSASAARATTGGFSILPGGADDETCRSQRLSSSLEDELRIVVAVVDAYKETEDAHREAPESHMFQARVAHVQDQLATVRAGLKAGDFEAVFETAERDSLSLAATTMTGPSGWIYWQPETLRVFDRVRNLREDGIPAYFSTDTGATVYVNTTASHADEVARALEELPLRDVHVWQVGGPARLVSDRALF